MFKNTQIRCLGDAKIDNYFFQIQSFFVKTTKLLCSVQKALQWRNYGDYHAIICQYVSKYVLCLPIQNTNIAIFSPHFVHIFAKPKSRKNIFLSTFFAAGKSVNLIVLDHLNEHKSGIRRIRRRRPSVAQLLSLSTASSGGDAAAIKDAPPLPTARPVPLDDQGYFETDRNRRVALSVVGQDQSRIQATVGVRLAGRVRRPGPCDARRV